jgi:hypothetical protein
MNAFQKVLIAGTAFAVVITSIYEIRRASTIETRAQILEAKQSEDASELEELRRQRDEAVAAQSYLQQENHRLTQAAAEIPKLRGELAQLGVERRTPTSSSAGVDSADSTTQYLLASKARIDKLAKYLEQRPESNIPELQFLDPSDWLNATKSKFEVDAKLETDVDIRKALSKLRGLAKNNLPMGSALLGFVRDNNGQLPTDLSQLKPYFARPHSDSSGSHWRGVDPAQGDSLLDSILARYQLTHSGNVNDYPADTWFIVEKAPVDKEYDSRMKVGPGRSMIMNGAGPAPDPDDSSYFH